MRRRPVRRRRVAAHVPAPPDAKAERKLARYAAKARADMDSIDQLSPYQRAILKFFGSDVLNRLPSGLTAEEIPRRLGKAKEFAEYWAEFRKPFDARKEAEKERIASVWSGLM